MNLHNGIPFLFVISGLDILESRGIIVCDKTVQK